MSPGNKYCISIQFTHTPTYLHVLGLALRVGLGPNNQLYIEFFRKLTNCVFIVLNKHPCCFDLYKVLAIPKPSNHGVNISVKHVLRTLVQVHQVRLLEALRQLLAAGYLVVC